MLMRMPLVRVGRNDDYGDAALGVGLGTTAGPSLYQIGSVRPFPPHSWHFPLPPQVRHISELYFFSPI